MVLLLLTLTFLSSICASVSPRTKSYPDSDAQNVLGSRVVIRNATLADVDDITDIVVDAYAPSPEWKYVYQFREQHRKYHWECMRSNIKLGFEQLKHLDDVIVKVIDAPTSRDADKIKAVAIAIWDLNTADKTGHLAMTMSRNCSANLDMNLTRALHVDRQFSAAKKEYIDEAYDRQVYLNLLCTHPDYDGRGFGAAHCEWGKELARERGENVTLIATPPGYQLYRTIGFESVANISFTKVGGGPLTWSEVMVYEV